MTLAILFPGQGSQQPGLLSGLPDSPSVVRTVTAARSLLEGLGVEADLDCAAALSDTTNVQLSLLVAEVACARALVDDYGLSARFVAGHSVGAFAAAVTAGALTFPEALEIVQLRGNLMQSTCRDGHWGMAAVRGLPLRRILTLVDEVSCERDPLWLANVNSATQIVVSGTTAALQRAAHAALVAGALAFDYLDVNVASHCSLQDSTAAALARRLSDVPRRPLTMSYLTNVKGRRVTDSSAVLDDLAQSVAKPVRWHDATRLVAELGATCAIEVPPGQVLTRLLAGSASEMIPISVSEVGLVAAAARARRLS